MSQQSQISAQQVEQLIAQGEPVVIHEGYALNISKWIDSHPGGRLAILHMVGRDATDEINMYAHNTLGSSERLRSRSWSMILTLHSAAIIPTKLFL